MNKRKIVLLFFILIIFLFGIYLVFGFVTSSQNFCLNLKSASYILDCERGCCTDEWDLLHNAYPKELCLSQNGSFVSGICKLDFLAG
jgi:hypothetical protein